MPESRFNVQDSQLISDLLRLSKTSPKLVRSTAYTAPSDPTVELRSWKMNEFKYYDVPSPFPTLARGLFSRELDDETGSDQPRYQIVARGYDKFFNIGEVPWTDWSSLEGHTGPDYTLSVKSNGCIIFIAAISPTKLIVTSKHALGGMDGVRETHSQAGHRWLKVHLSSKEKTEEQLAAILHQKNWTAVAELCDDEFEEHVLPYPPEKSGLYLHGINESKAEFRTLPPSVIDAFAQEWGFLRTETIKCDTLAQVKQFTDGVAKTGKWKGESVEGFVVRTTIVDQKPGMTTRDKRPPYPTGSSFFFKVKFDEPYLMYRDWREITKSLLSAKGSLNHATIPKSMLKRKETQVYVKWVKNEINKNRDAFQGYLQGKGIIATRERFLRWLNSEEGSTDPSDIEEPRQNFGKTIIVPVAVPGCGKTSVAIALTHLFGFGHTQSDDVQGKKPAATFIKNVVSLLNKHDVVIADKNNHLQQHRQALRGAVSRMDPPVRLLALNWTLNEASAEVLRVCANRIYGRGDRHQTLRADKNSKSHEDIIWRFIQSREKLGHAEVDESIEMAIEEPLEKAVARAVDGCVEFLGLERPTKEQMDAAIAAAQGYAPLKSKNADEKNEGKTKAKSPRYFGILAEINVEALVETRMEQAEDVPYNGKAFWAKLVREKRITDRPHVTLVHQAELPGAADLWARCAALDRLPSPPLLSFALGHLVWNERVMAITVDDVELASDPANDEDTGQERHAFVSLLSAEVRAGLHITVGTANGDVSPFEARGLVEAWRKGKRHGIGSLELEGLSAKGRIRGLM